MAMATADIIIAVTAAIMSTEAQVIRERPIVASVTMVLAVAMLLLAAQRCIAYAYVASMPADISEALGREAPIAADKLQRSSDALQKAVAVLPSASLLHRELGRIQLHSTKGQGKAPSDIAARLKLAGDEFDQSIATAPARALPWALAAQARDQAGAPFSTIIPYLQYSAYLAPREASSLLLRTRIAVPHWAELPDDLRASIRQELRELWVYPDLRYAFVDRYLKASFELRGLMLRDAIQTPADRKKFQQQIKKALGF